MSSWMIFPDAGNTYRWEHRRLDKEPDHSPVQQPSLYQSIPSMADLLLQGCSKLKEKRCDELDNAPMFRTGLGKSVSIQQSSLSRAMAILDDGYQQVNGTGILSEGVKEFGFSNSMSLTSSRKATNTPCSMEQAVNKKTDFTSSCSSFQTASGKLVSVSSAGLDKAKRLLGLEDNSDIEYFDGLVHEREHATTEEPLGWQSSHYTNVREGDMPTVTVCGDARLHTSNFDLNANTIEGKSEDVIPDTVLCGSKPPPIKFQTAGGRSISVSSNALKRARSLLGDLEAGATSSAMKAADNTTSPYGVNEDNYNFLNKVPDTDTPTWQQITASNGVSTSKKFTSPLRSNLCQKQSTLRSGILGAGNNLIKKFDAEASENGNKPVNSASKNLEQGSSRRPLVDVSNRIDVAVTDKKWISGEKRSMGRITVSSFKKPRVSKFVTPFNGNQLTTSNGPSPLGMKDSTATRRVCTRFPFQIDRLYMKEYIKDAPSCRIKAENLADQIWRMNPNAAEKYAFPDEFGSYSIGAEAFYHMLIQSGASVHYISKKWVSNHYKWIVWKLASYERCYPAKFSGKLLTTSNVLEELKYRYEREVNHGHRSAIKTILGGDTPPSTRILLCVSSVSVLEVGHQTTPTDGANDAASVKIELTDGWYSIYALLDALLTKKLYDGKVFVGQKLRIWGAGFHGWLGPVSPLEASSATSLQLHINGTYRAHWADRLGFCRNAGFPLAFRSIKNTGGVVPCTLVGILRVYPVLYRERLSDGGFVFRSERMEEKVLQLYQQKRSNVEEGVMSEFQRGSKKLDHNIDYDENDEGAKLLKILETTAEPEVLMAEMSSEQLTSFASYKAKLEAMRQADILRCVEKAFVAAGLSDRQVTPFMRVKVIGLTGKEFQGKCIQRTGLITIWNPTEKQQVDLEEGEAYAVDWLMPSSSDSSTLYLQGRGSSTTWRPLSPLTCKQFASFFSPRRSVLLSNLGEIPLSSEFDVAAFVIYVGDAYATASQKKQWVFVTDGSIRDSSETLLAISFCTPLGEREVSTPVNPAIVGSTVGFCNVLKKAKDEMNKLWVAEATENSTYSITFGDRKYSHLKDTAVSAQKWANVSVRAVENLKRRVNLIISKSNV